MKSNSITCQCSPFQKTWINPNSTLVGNFLFLLILATMTSNRNIFCQRSTVMKSSTYYLFFSLHLRLALFWRKSHRWYPQFDELYKYKDNITIMYMYPHRPPSLLSHIKLKDSLLFLSPSEVQFYQKLWVNAVSNVGGTKSSSLHFNNSP